MYNRYNKATCLKTISKSLGNNLNIINFLVRKHFQCMYLNSNSQPYSRYTVEAYFLFVQEFEYEPSQAKLFTPYNQVQDFLFGLPLVAYSYFIFLSDRILLWVLHIRRITLCLGCQNLIACFKCSLKRKSH